MSLWFYQGTPTGGKAQYHWPPCTTNYLRSASFYIGNIFNIKLNEDFKYNEPSSLLVFPGLAIDI